MERSRIWLLLSLQLSGEATPEERSELEQLLKQYPDAGLQAEMFRDFWQNKSDDAAVAGRDTYNRHLQRLSNLLAAPALQYERAEPETTTIDTGALRPGKRRRFLIGLAAAAVVSAIAVILWLDPVGRPVKSPVALNTISTRPGLKSKMQLPDGTSVWLNAGSHITYDEKFDGALREVQLIGEAFFDVVKDSARPFVIHTSAVDIKVLGTAFNVRSYPNEKSTETALIRGRVEITLHNNPDKKIILRPSEKLVVNNDITDVPPTELNSPQSREEETMMTLSKLHVSDRDSSIAETKWISDRLAFDGTPFDDIVSGLERLYNVRFVVTNEGLRKKRFTGSFENKSLSEIMEALQFSGRFHYRFENNTVTVW